MVSQITRAAVSIPSNIAEGSSRNSDKDKKRFVEIAMGSAFELETQLLIIRDLKLANPVDADKLIDELHEEQRMINSFITTLKPTANSQEPKANNQQPTPNSQKPTANSQQPTPNSQKLTANS